VYVCVCELPASGGSASRHGWCHSGQSSRHALLCQKAPWRWSVWVWNRILSFYETTFLA
jgi:hypothetical protein